jgi:hypothetical protein
VIWRFEGGPWDGHRIELHDGMLAPMYQIVELLGHEPVRYELAAKEDPATFVYRPNTLLSGSTSRAQ